MEFKPENKKKGLSTARVDPLPCVSTIITPAIPRRVNLTERSWPFVGSFALHAVLFGILFFQLTQPPIVVSSVSPNVLWFSPIVVSGKSGHTASMQSQPDVTFAQQTETAESVSIDRYEDAIENNHPTTQITSPSITAAESDGMPLNADLVVIRSPSYVRSEADRISLNPLPAPRYTKSPTAPVVIRNPSLPSSEPTHKEQQALASEQPGIIQAEKEPSYSERTERQGEADRLSRNLAAQKQALAENALREQLVRRQQALQALREQSERERIAAEEIRQEQDTREQLLRERKLQEERELLAAERTRQALRAREQEQQALREQVELKRIAAEKERQAREQLQRELKLQEQQARLAAERTRQAQRFREQEQRAHRDQTEKIRVAAEMARQEREVQEQMLRDRKLQEAMVRRKEREQLHEQPVHRPLAVSVNKQENLVPKVPENNAGHSPAQKPQKGLSLPLLKGDLKLVLTGAKQPRITITFKEFALSRRNRPFSRVEARRESVVSLLIATTQENTREVVIEQVRPGVYVVTGEPVDGSSEFACLLKLHEGTSKMSVRDIGRHTLVQKKVLLKILMPDGILWDDNKSFTGSMEDSDSITKFNAETGLTWKEYFY